MPSTASENDAAAAAVASAGIFLACSSGSPGATSLTSVYTNASQRNSSRVGQRLKNAFRLVPGARSGSGAAASRMTSSVRSQSSAAGK
jgi:uncharacterized lipoprotein NlpE involved in copper resistance